ncbi:hypothetical protein [Stutzerimonas nitrititolerans]|uniref:hypothetical protein n=1 Tax=Stutzerimonas nitrititolerans TaxID=2482751 RepID=UPI0028A0DF0D|nr:hypothetical protein [Stutzerimonas nitrititolerans]
MWLFFALFLIVGLGAMFTSFLSGLIMLLAASIFVPQVNRAIKDKTNFAVTPGARAVIAIVCLGLFFYTSNKAMDADRAERQAQEALANQQKAEQAQIEKREYVSANKDAILAEMSALIAKQDYAGATALGTKYSNAGSFEIDQALSKVSEQKAEAEKQQKKAALLATLTTIKSDDYKSLASTYSQLAVIDSVHQANADKFSKLAEQSDREAKVREKAAAEKATRKAMGLVWNYSDDEDQMSGKPVKRAYVSSINTVNFGFPYAGSQRATLSLRKHPRWGSSAYMRIEKGQFICNYSNCYMTVRFDSGKSQRYFGSEPESNDSTIIFINDYKGLVAQAKRSKKLFIEANFYQEGSRVFEFDISELDWK